MHKHRYTFEAVKVPTEDGGRAGLMAAIRYLMKRQGMLQEIIFIGTTFTHLFGIFATYYAYY